MTKNFCDSCEAEIGVHHRRVYFEYDPHQGATREEQYRKAMLLCDNCFDRVKRFIALLDKGVA